jgi:hypothetical protein
MRRYILILLLIVTSGGCATQSGVSGGVKSPGAASGTLRTGVIHSQESVSRSQGFVSGNGTIQRSTRIPGGYPHYHTGYPARGHFDRQQHQRHEYHIQPRGRIRYDRGDVQIRGEW